MSSSSDQSAKTRKFRGRRKVNMVKMTNEGNLQVTFSKRRAGLFKKSSELCTLSGAEAAIIVFSPANKAYSFGSPDVDTIAYRFLNDEFPPNNYPPEQMIMEAHRSSNVRLLNLELTQIESKLASARKHSEMLDRMRVAAQVPDSFDEFYPSQLCVLSEAISSMKKELDDHVEKCMLRLAPATLSLYPARDHGSESSCTEFTTFNGPLGLAASTGFHDLNAVNGGWDLNDPNYEDGSSAAGCSYYDMLPVNVRASGSGDFVSHGFINGSDDAQQF